MTGIAVWAMDGLDNGQFVGLELIELRKAFDTVDHSILCHKLEHFGLQEKVYHCLSLIFQFVNSNCI